MDVLRDLIICPICHGELGKGSTSDETSLSCKDCARVYERQGDSISMIPSPLSEPLLEKWNLWDKLQWKWASDL